MDGAAPFYAHPATSQCNHLPLPLLCPALHRFSSDTSTVDDALPFMLNLLLANAVSLAGVLAVLCWVQPLLLAALLPLALLYRHVSAVYRCTARELRRLDALSMSPVYGAFGEAVEGAPTIRAFGVQHQFQQVQSELGGHSQVWGKGA